MKKFLQHFLPSSSDTTHRKFEVLKSEIGKNKKWIRENELDSLYLMCKANEICSVHHDTFLPYKGIHKDREVVVVGSGPTLQYYSPVENAIHIGVNGSYHCDKFKLDYLFVQDFEGEGKEGVFYVEELKRLNCKKFVGQYIKDFTKKAMVAPEYIADYIGGKSYYVHDYYQGHFNYKHRIPLNLEFYPLVDNASTIFAALQFALYTHPKRIYIVGCDCSYANGQHFDNVISPQMNVNVVYKNWELMKEHILTYFSDIEIVSVNPVGLAGMFRDDYTQEYVRQYIHGDINR